MTQVAAAISTVIFMAAFIAAIALSAATHQRQYKFPRWRHVLRALPYGVALNPAVESWNFRHDIVDATGWAVLFLLLTWVLVWSARKQWGT